VNLRHSSQGLLREPLLHFLLLGALIFAVHAWLTRDVVEPRPERQVAIGESELRWLQETWVRQWGREPTPEELRGLLIGLLREELLSREARELGLDVDDTIVRRRLAQKVEFMVQDAAQLAEPQAGELEAFHAANPALFTTAPKRSFAQLFFSRERRKDAAADAQAALSALGRGADPATLGDRLLVESEFTAAEPRTVEGLFGKAFADAVFALEPGTWRGPVESAYGLHLVRVTTAEPGTPQAFAAVQAEVLEEWRERKQREANAAYFSGLMNKYEVVLDPSVAPLIGPLDAVVPAQ
jgi:hypothetical protein